MQSYAGSDGSYTLTVTFAIGTDLNFAQVLVQNRVAIALSSLPQSVQVQGVTVQKKSTAILQIVTLTSPEDRYDSLFLANLRDHPAARTRSRGCRASATSPCSAPASIRCGSGSIPTGCRRAASPPRT